MNNSPYGSLFGPAATPISFTPGGHGATELDTDNVRGAPGVSLGSEIFGDDAGFTLNIGHCVVTHSNANMIPEQLENQAEVVDIPGPHPNRFDFRDELTNLLYESTASIDTLGRMLRVLMALARGTMTLNTKFVAESRNSNVMGGISFKTYDSQKYLDLHTALMKIYSRVTSGQGGVEVIYPTISMMRRAGQEWNRHSSFGTTWDFCLRRLVAEGMRRNSLANVRNILPVAFFDGVDSSTFRRLLALHITTYSTPFFNPSNATYVYKVPSTVGTVGPQHSDINAQYVSASVLAVLGGRFGGRNAFVV